MSGRVRSDCLEMGLGGGSRVGRLGKFGRGRGAEAGGARGIRVDRAGSGSLSVQFIFYYAK